MGLYILENNVYEKQCLGVLMKVVVIIGNTSKGENRRYVMKANSEQEGLLYTILEERK